jgi:hypothetical protein
MRHGGVGSDEKVASAPRARTCVASKSDPTALPRLSGGAGKGDIGRKCQIGACSDVDIAGDG